MTSIHDPGGTPRTTASISRAVGVVMMAALVGLSPLIPALAEPASLAGLFGRKYNAFYRDNLPSSERELTLHAASFQTLVETQVNGVPGVTRPSLIGGIHQGVKAITVGSAANQPVRFEYQTAGPINIRIGEKSMVTGLTAAQAKPMALLVAEENNGLVGLNERVTHKGNRGFKAKVARSYIDTEEGYWLLWADAISEELFYRVDFDYGRFPTGLTIVDSERPVTISTDGPLEVRGGDPRVAFWKYVAGERGAILRYDELALIEPRNQGDVRALETVRRVFKWAPVMRLAAEHDPAAFKSFASALEKAPVASVSTPRLLIED